MLSLRFLFGKLEWRHQAFFKNSSDPNTRNKTMILYGNSLTQEKLETLKQEIVDIIVCFYVNRQYVFGDSIGSWNYSWSCFARFNYFCFGWIHFSSALPFWNLLFISHWPTLQATTHLRKLDLWRHPWNPESELTSLGHLALIASLTKLLEMCTWGVMHRVPFVVPFSPLESSIRVCHTHMLCTRYRKR